MTQLAFSFLCKQQDDEQGRKWLFQDLSSMAACPHCTWIKLGDSLHDFHKFENSLIKFKWRNEIAERQESIYTFHSSPSWFKTCFSKFSFLPLEAAMIDRWKQIKIIAFIKLQDIISHSSTTSYCLLPRRCVVYCDLRAIKEKKPNITARVSLAY